MHRAAIGNFKLVREFLKRGAGVNVKNRKGNTPLNFAVKTSNKSLEIIRELLEYGADINIRNHRCRGSDDHRTPLDNTVDYSACAELLIKITLIKNFDKNYRKIINLDPYKGGSYYSKLSSYLDDCVREITKMKTDSIDNSLSLYEFIISKEANKEVLYVNDGGVKSIRNRVFQVLTSTNYPIYHGVISAKIGASLERTSLLNKLSELEIYTKCPIIHRVFKKKL
ncbi:MAG: ankyrin repeat domain-containing protein [Wolbachia sp.]